MATAKFKFVGNPRDRNDAARDITVKGVHFPVGEAVDIEDETIAEKLRGNSHFEEIGGTRKGKGGPQDKLAAYNLQPDDPAATRVPTTKDSANEQAAYGFGAGQSSMGRNDVLERERQADEALAAREERQKAAKARDEADKGGGTSSRTAVSKPPSK